MNSALYTEVILSFISAALACEFGHRRQKVHRGIYARFAVLALCGFSGMLVSMVVLSVLSKYQIFAAVISGGCYGYTMANAKAFEKIR